MDEHDFRNFIESLKKEPRKGKKQVTLKLVNFAQYHIDMTDEGNISIANMAHLYGWIKETLTYKCQVLHFLSSYHKDSPSFWNRADKIKKDEEGFYDTGIDLERFMESSKSLEQKDMAEETGYFIPDNYELAETVLKEFMAIPANKNYKLEDTSFREYAEWRSKDIEAVKALSEYIDKKYVQPQVKKYIKFNKIATVEFIKSQISFTYTNTK